MGVRNCPEAPRIACDEPRCLQFFVAASRLIRQPGGGCTCSVSNLGKATILPERPLHSNATGCAEAFDRNLETHFSEDRDAHKIARAHTGFTGLSFRKKGGEERGNKRRARCATLDSLLGSH